jgi:two-component system, NarL family, sensor histidine kinase FusK
MRKVWSGHEWGRHLAIAAGYLLVFMVLRPFSEPYWRVLEVLRLSCLLFLPYRYWLTLPLMDTIGQSFNVIPHPEFGLTWMILTLIPSIVAAMPIVWWCRTRLNLFPNREQINFHVLLLCSMLCALAWSLLSYVALAHAFNSPGHPYPVLPITPLTEFMGKYIPLVAVMPCVLMARAELLSAKPWRKRWRAWVRHVFAIDTLALITSIALFLLWLSHHNSEDARRLSYLVMYLPITWLTLKPGWRATALGGAPAILCMVSLLRWHGHDSIEIFRTEAFMALTMTCLFILGARITAQRQQEEQKLLDAQQAIVLARRNIQLNEMRLKKTAQALELAGSAMSLAHHQILTRFRHVLPANEAQRYYRQATAAQNQVSQLADSMHPAAWRQRGLPAALHETIGSVLKEAGLAYLCTIEGAGLMDLTSEVQTAIYRVACESVAFVNTQMVCSQVRVRLRGGISSNAYWAVLRVEGTLEPAYINDSIYDTSERQFLASKLGAHGLEPEALRNHVRLFGGELHERITAKGVRLTYLLVDRATQRGNEPAAINPWIT